MLCLHISACSFADSFPSGEERTFHLITPLNFPEKDGEQAESECLNNSLFSY